MLPKRHARNMFHLRQGPRYGSRTAFSVKTELTCMKFPKHNMSLVYRVEIVRGVLQETARAQMPQAPSVSLHAWASRYARSIRASSTYVDVKEVGSYALVERKGCVSKCPDSAAHYAARKMTDLCHSIVRYPNPGARQLGNVLLWAFYTRHGAEASVAYSDNLV
jgi:hypothetical protein